jgi:hypothetical protein
MWTSFGNKARADASAAGAASAEGGEEAPKGAEIDELKAQLTAMQERIERLAKDR